MAGTIDMQDMRYLNLFEKITRVSTRFCFKYNEAIVFCVPKNLVSRAIGEKGINVKKMNEILGKRIKVIPQPLGISDAKKFFELIVSPVTFKDLEVNDEIILTAGSQSKAALIGRNKRRLLELQKISKDYFGKELKIV
jgi:NusA-like KH domain protein